MGSAPGCLTYGVPVCKVLPLEGTHTHQWIPQTKVPQRGARRAERGSRNLLVSSTGGALRSFREATHLSL